MFNPEGIIVAMVTPMTSNEDLDEAILRKAVNYYIDKGVQGLFCLSTNGEFFSLTYEEKIRMVEIVMDEARGRVQVWVGTGGITTREVIKLTKEVEAMGADAVSVITPYVISPSQEEMFVHYQRIAESVNLPIIIYNIPAKTQVSISPNIVQRLAEIDNIVGIKDSSGDFKNILQYIQLTPIDFSVLSGNDGLVYWTLLAGGKGSVSGMANIFPEIMVGIYRLWKEGKYEEAKEMQDKIAPIRSTLGFNTFPSIVKMAMELSGKPVGPTRSPILMPDESIKTKVEEVINKHYLQYTSSF
ncbi:MAG: 4-hydroxy-tetrahydrodipicolinate synthase [Firmicutes bacterium]|nr:4-hydroxy-tetrahydrodipicolinate synthase [Bacillota bacterium]